MSLLRPNFLFGVVSVLSLFASALLFDRAFILIDEGHIATIASRILDGQVLYRDVQTGIFPGVYYLTAALFAAFGEDIIVTRIAQIGVNLATVFIMWRLAARVTGRWWALLAPALYCAMIPLGFPVYVMFAYSGIALLFGLTALLAAFRYLENGRLLDGLATGVFLALCALTKQNYGAFFGISIAVGLMWMRSASALAEKPIVSLFLPIVGTGAAVTVSVFAPLFLEGAGPQFLQYTLLTLFDSQLTAFDQPLPNILGELPMNDGRWAFLYSPGLLFNYLIRGEPLLGVTITQELRELALRVGYGSALSPLILAPISRVLLRSEHSQLSARQADVIVITGILSFLGIFPSAIWSHLVAVLPPLLMLGAIVAASIAASVRSRPVTIMIASIVLSAVALLLVAATAATFDLRRWNSESIGVRHAAVRVSPDNASVLRDSVAFLESCASPGEPVYVAPDIPGVLFLTDRPNRTPYDILIPGDIDESRLIADLDAVGVNCIVYNPRMYIHFRELSIHFPMFTHFVETAFEPVAQLGSGKIRWQGLRRRTP